MYRLASVLCLCLAALAAPAGAGPLTGQTFTATYQVPTVGAIYGAATWAPATFAVGAGVETVGTVEGVTTITADFGANSLSLLLNTVLTSPTWNIAPFNGPVFTAALPLGITGASVDAAGTTLAGFDASRVTVTANEIRVDWNGLSYTDGTRVEIVFAVPEPATLGLLALGLGGLAAARWRRRPALPNAANA